VGASGSSATGPAGCRGGGAATTIGTACPGTARQQGDPPGSGATPPWSASLWPGTCASRFAAASTSAGDLSDYDRLREARS
jgi:hypothetical protein